MARNIGRITALAVSRTKARGLYADGGGLYLQVSASGARSWTYRFMLNGRAREMGLGPLHAVGLSQARAKAMECRRLRLAGIDPIDARKDKRTSVLLEAAKAVIFKDAANAYIEAHEAGWRNATHIKQWHNTLKTYAFPVFGSSPVQQVDVTLVMKALEPIWNKKPQTASRLRGRIEQILDWAKARGYRGGENPARWRGHLESLLPAPTKVRRVSHHPALAYDKIGSFMLALREQNGIAAAALDFLILTATRTGETIGARWSEIDLDKAIWTIPGSRIKAGKEHRIPLSAPALKILKRMAELGGGDFVFASGRANRPLCNMALLALLQRMERHDITTHGFRSTFRDWTAEQTNYPREVAEMALAHTVGNQVEAAYRRGDLFDKRRQLMNEWARYCASPRSDGKIVPIRKRST